MPATPPRRGLLAGLAVLGAALAPGGCAQDAAVAPRREQGVAAGAVAGPEAPAQTAAPPPQGPPPSATRGRERAPVPDRDLEGPRGAGTTERLRLSPTFILPRGTVRGGTFEGDPFHRQQDRLFDQPAPGATLRLPFSY